MLRSFSSRDCSATGAVAGGTTFAALSVGGIEAGRNGGGGTYWWRCTGANEPLVASVQNADLSRAGSIAAEAGADVGCVSACKEPNLGAAPSSEPHIAQHSKSAGYFACLLKST
jgi:hypothetical protein